MKIAEIANKINTHNLSGIYLVEGINQYLHDKITSIFKNSIPVEDQSMNINFFDLEIDDLEMVVRDAKESPFLGDRKIIFIKNPLFLTGSGSLDAKQAEAFMDYLNHPNDMTTIIVLAKYSKLDGRKKIVKVLKKQAVNIDLNNISELDIKQWVNDEINHQGYQIKEDVLLNLLQRTDYDLSLIMQELDKLYNYNFPIKEISAISVDNLVTDSINYTIFELIDALFKLDMKSVLNVYDHLRSVKEDPIKINSLLISNTRLLIQTKILSTKNESNSTIAGSLKVHPYRVKLAAGVVKKFALRTLEDVYIELADIDLKLKTTSTDPRLLFEMFILKFKSLNERQKSFN